MIYGYVRVSTREQFRLGLAVETAVDPFLPVGELEDLGELLIAAGKAMELYQILGLGDLDCSVAILKNVTSGKLGSFSGVRI